ncbi:hypothetical protein CKO22_12510 [Thiococcus pfennigii]|nr:hypothetical protein [Thiococcus pfennigii]
MEDSDLIGKWLNQRAEQQAVKPNASIAGACGGWVEAQAACRFIVTGNSAALLRRRRRSAEVRA